jgi:hypothetical protein
MSESPAQLPDVPQGFLTYPTHSVLALLPDIDDAMSATQDLEAAGYSRDERWVLVGPEGAERLDINGRHHGLHGRIYRLVGHLGDDREELVNTAHHLRSGGVALRVHAEEERKADAARILRAHGSEHSVYLGRGHFEPLGP